MARRAFRLAALLRLRQAQENQAAGALARAGADLNAAKDEALAARAASASHRFTDATSGQWMASVAARASLQAMVGEAEAEVAVAQREVDERTQQWQSRRRATKSLEHLQSRHDSEAMRAQLAAEQQAMDEFGGRRRLGDNT